MQTDSNDPWPPEGTRVRIVQKHGPYHRWGGYAGVLIERFGEYFVKVVGRDLYVGPVERHEIEVIDE